MSCKVMVVSGVGLVWGLQGIAAEGKGAAAVPLPAWLQRKPWLQLPWGRTALRTALLPPLLSSP